MIKMGRSLYFRNALLIIPLLGFCFGEEYVVPGEKNADFETPSAWPQYNHFGQISAVGVDNLGNLYIFHRGNRQWNAYSFSTKNIFVDINKGPIPNETLVILEPNTGSLIRKTGSNIFYLPHGLTIDHENNIWLTDVGLHQVFKFPPLNLKIKSNYMSNHSLSLGVAFEPGNDDRHFCKPTDVAVDRETKEFYVSDGYCNSRIIKYDEHGKKLMHWGRQTIGTPHNYFLNVPHSLALAQGKKILFVADRENFRVVSYNSISGKYNGTIAENLKSRIYSVAYLEVGGGFIFVLSTGTTFPNTISIYSVQTNNNLTIFRNNFTNPHDIALSPDGKFCYVVELNPHKIWKFQIDLPKIKQVLQPLQEVEKVPAESKIISSKDSDASSFLAIGLVVSLIVISFLIFKCHYYKAAGYRRYESRRLILDEDDEEGGSIWRNYRNFVCRVLDKYPGKEYFGIYRFLPVFFFLGASIEYMMIFWRPNGVNFYERYKKRMSHEVAIKRYNLQKEIEKLVN